MFENLECLEITITKTANGAAEYVQIASPGAIPVNIVLIANQITVNDQRKQTTKRRRLTK